MKKAYSHTPFKIIKAMRNILNRILRKLNQGKSDRNRVVFETLQALGYSMPQIRRALISLNDVNIRKVTNDKISLPTVYATLNGSSFNQEAMAIISGSLGLARAELFPEKEPHPSRRVEEPGSGTAPPSPGGDVR